MLETGLDGALGAAGRAAGGSASLAVSLGGESLVDWGLLGEVDFDRGNGSMSFSAAGAEALYLGLAADAGDGEASASALARVDGEEVMDWAVDASLDATDGVVGMWDVAGHLDEDKAGR